MSEEIDDQKDNADKHSKEIKSIASWYGERFNQCSKEIVDETGLKYEVWPVGRDQKYSASLRFSLPDKYPEKPAVVEVNSTWMTDEEEEEVNKRFGEKLKENGGKGIGMLDAWIEILREYIEATTETEREKDNQTPQNEEFNEAESAEEDDEQNDPEAELVQSTCPEISHGEKITDRKSTFQAHLAVITSKDQVQQVLAKLKENNKIAKATYNIWAYRIFDPEKNVYVEDCDDDGESAAGGRLLHLLETSNASNVIIIVTRWHGNIKLGAERFQHINECAKLLLQAEGIIEGKDAKDKGRGKVKKH